MRTCEIAEYRIESNELDVSLSEVLRYMGVHGTKNTVASDDKADKRADDEANDLISGGVDSELVLLAKKALNDVKKESVPSVIYTGIRDILRTGNVIDIGFGAFCSDDVHKYLSECEKAMFFCATVGIGTDRLVQRYKSLKPTLALAYNAAGTALAEALCDKFCKFLPTFCDFPDNKVLSEGTVFHCKSRVSPGYGDIPLDCQPMLLESLDAFRRQGIRLNDSLLMTPTKTVTAFVGIVKGKI